MPKVLMSGTGSVNELGLGDGDTAPFRVRSKESFIEWPTEREIQKVSEQLARIRRAGIRLEAGGNYFKSGELAYEIQEMIRATAELFKKSQRAKL